MAKYPALEEFLKEHAGREVTVMNTEQSCTWSLSLAMAIGTLFLLIGWSFGAFEDWSAALMGAVLVGAIASIPAILILYYTLNRLRGSHLKVWAELQLRIDALEAAREKGQLERDLSPLAGLILDAICLHRTRIYRAWQSSSSSESQTAEKLWRMADHALFHAVKAVDPFFSPGYGEQDGPLSHVQSEAALQQAAMLRKVHVHRDVNNSHLPPPLKAPFRNALLLAQAADLLEPTLGELPEGESLSLHDLLKELSERQEAEQELESFLNQSK